MPDPTNDELKIWAESLRDQVSRISGRTWNGKNSDFSSELKGDLLDAIDLLLEQAGGREPPVDPLTQLMDQISQTMAECVQRSEQVARSAIESSQDRFSEIFERAERLCQNLEHEHQQQTEQQGQFGHNLSEWLGRQQQQQEQDQARVEKAEAVLTNLQRTVEHFSGSQTRHEESMESRLNDVLQQHQDALARAGDLCQALEQERQALSQRHAQLDERMADWGGVQADVQAALENSQEHMHRLQDSASQLPQQIQSAMDSCGTQVETAMRHALQDNLGVFQRTEELCANLEAECSRQATRNSEMQEQLGKWLEQQDSAREFFQESQQLSRGALQKIEKVSENLRRQSDGSEVEELEKELDQLRSQLEQAGSSRDELIHKIEQLEEQHRQVDAQRAEVQHRCQQAESRARELEDDSQRQQDRIQEVEGVARDLETQLRTVEDDERHRAQENEEMLALLQEELAEARQHIPASTEGGRVADDAVAEIEELEDELYQTRQEVEDLKIQNSDLAAQVAKQQVLNSGSEAQLECDEDNLSWEDRKRLIMQQYAEDEADPQDDRREEIEQVIATTERELERRNQEIEELRQQLNQESQAEVESPIAKVLDESEAIQQEREKLQAIQLEWEQKLRQAEIDLSMERAKLARERTELEAELGKIREQEDEEIAEKPQGRTRKWLDHLGLRDDKRRE